MLEKEGKNSVTNIEIWPTKTKQKFIADKIKRNGDLFEVASNLCNSFQKE